jgi:DNA repair photolyase
MFALGGPEFIRVRIDPIIIGYTTPGMVSRSLDVCQRHGITRVITNFLVPEYKGVGPLLVEKRHLKPEHLHPKQSQMLRALHAILENCQSRGIQLAVCAETSWALEEIPELKRAACADADWAVSLNPDLAGKFSKKPSRRGCGCCYSADWGAYASRGGYTCPHGCIYCYAK